MKNNNRMNLIFSTLAALCLTTLTAPSYATIAKFSLVPTTPTTVTVPTNNNAIVQYTVTNNTKVSRTLTMVPMPGITQLTSDPSYCSHPFTLGSQQSCLLTLSLDGSQLPSASTKGPSVCKTTSSTNNQPDLSLCSQPSPAYLLSVTTTSNVPSNDQAVYVTNWRANSISLCFANPQNGMLEYCNLTAVGGTLSEPEAIAVNSNATRLYVANVTGSAPGSVIGSVSLCQINPQTAALSGCKATGSHFASPDGIAINHTGTIAYVSNIVSNDVTYCEIDASTGEFFNCNSTGSNFATPSDIAINRAGTYVYVGNFTGDSVTTCAINNITPPLGTLTCNAPITGFFGPEGITIQPPNISGFDQAYISNNNNNTVSLCSVTGGGATLSDCIITGGAFNGFGNVAFNNTGLFAYVPNGNASSVSVCSADPFTGPLSACVNSGGTGFTDPSGIVVMTRP